MSASPPYKVYSADGEYLASCHHLEHEAMIVAGIGVDRTTIRLGHGIRQTLWAEGSEAFSASESYDGVADTCLRRIPRRPTHPSQATR